MIKKPLEIVMLTAAALVICSQSVSAQEGPRHADAESKLVVTTPRSFLRPRREDAGGIHRGMERLKQQADFVSVQSGDFSSVSLIEQGSLTGWQRCGR